MSIYDQIAQGTGGQLTQGAMNRYTMQRQQAMDLQAKEQADRAYGLQDRQQSMKDAKDRLDILGKMAVHLKNQPEAQKAAFYKRQLDILNNMGWDTSKFPQEYQPGMEDLAIQDVVKYGKQLQYYTDQEGNLQAAQVSELGGAKPIPAPSGGQWVKPPRTVDLGGQVVTMPYGSAYPTAAMPKTLAPAQEPAYIQEKKIAEKQGTAKAEAAINYPLIKDQAENSIRLIKELLADPGLSGAIGLKGPSQLFGLKEEPIAGSKEADFLVRLQQIQGKQFLQAYQTLKGGGQITEIEGKKAEAAIARMSRSQSETAFRKSANEFITILKTGLKRAEKAAKHIPAIGKPRLKYNPQTGEFE